MERHANGPLSGVILSIRGECQTIEDVESLRALQTVDEAHDAAIVAGDGGVDADFRNAAIGDFFLMRGEGINPQIGLFRDFIKLGCNGGRARALDRKVFFKLIAIAARKGHVVFDGLRRLDVASQNAKLGILLVKFPLWRLRGRGQPPAIDGQSEVRSQEQSEDNKDCALLQCEVAVHQLLRYSAFSSTTIWSALVPAEGRCTLPSSMCVNVCDSSRAFKNLTLASSLVAPMMNFTSMRPFSCFGSMLTTRTPAGSTFSKSMNISVQLKLRASMRLLM